MRSWPQRHVCRGRDDGGSRFPALGSMICAPPMPIVGRCATLRIMDQADSVHTELSAPGNIFYFVADLAAAAAWYSARLGAEPVTRAAQLVMFDLPGAG